MTNLAGANNRKKERIGLFGGTFNPIHSGHVKAARVVQNTCALEKILFIPSFIPPHKETGKMVSAAHRLNMVKLAIEGCTGFSASPIEIEARGKSYSILTLHKLKEIYAEAFFYFILGIDAFLEIESWKDYRNVLDQCSFIVVSRKGHCLEEAKALLGRPYEERIVGLSKASIRRPAHHGERNIYLLAITALDVSSTAIRQRLGQGLSIGGMVPPKVYKYIYKNKLYQ